MTHKLLAFGNMIRESPDRHVHPMHFLKLPLYRLNRADNVFKSPEPPAIKRKGFTTKNERERIMTEIIPTKKKKKKKLDLISGPGRFLFSWGGERKKDPKDFLLFFLHHNTKNRIDDPHRKFSGKRRGMERSSMIEIEFWEREETRKNIWGHNFKGS